MKLLQYETIYLRGKGGGKHGISPLALKRLAKRLKAVQKHTSSFLREGEQDFIRDLLSSRSEKDILAQAKGWRKRFSQLLVIGIGGSDLGARALQELFPVAGDKHGVFFLGDTTDPQEIASVCSKLDWKHCAVQVISKSGNTVETLAVFLAVRDRLVKAVGKTKHAEHVFVITEQGNGKLGALADLHGYTRIDHPPDIGGRWTVLTGVALLSAAFAGIDITSLRRGARTAYKKWEQDAKNPALVYAAAHFLAAKQGQSLAVFMAYAARFESFGQWYRQLFAESLGKARSRRGKLVHTGLTPLVSIGPKDQHSQIQLFNEGPFDKLITFLRVQDKPETMLPKPWKGEDDIAYLHGRGLAEILAIEQVATVKALAKHGRPSSLLILPNASEESLGQLFLFFELACVYLAELFNVNAFDQPGVEEGKHIMQAMLKHK